MKQPKLVAFIGAKGSGKTTLANRICQDPGHVRLSFATPIRKMVEAIGIQAYYHTENKDAPIPHIAGNPTARHVLQSLGTEWGRDLIHSDIWVYAALEIFKDYLEDGVSVYIDDARFPNEAEAVKSLGGHIIRVNPGPYANTEDSHISEAYWKSIVADYVLPNDGDLDDLYESYLDLDLS